jgi:hypothetical protein
VKTNKTKKLDKESAKKINGGSKTPKPGGPKKPTPRGFGNAGVGTGTFR